MTAMIRRTAKALESSIRRLERTAQLLDASRAFLNSHGSFIGGKLPGAVHDSKRCKPIFTKQDPALGPDVKHRFDLLTHESD